MVVELKETEGTRDNQPVEQDRTARGRSWAALWRFVEARLDWFVAGLLFLLAFAFMSPGLPPGNVAAPMDQLLAYPPWHTYYPNANPPARGGDLLLQQLPWKHWMQQELAAGRFPMWASSPAGGMPLFASMQPGVLDPLHLLWVLMPIGAGLGIILALKLWLAGLGMWLFLRALRLHPAACLMAALGFMFSAAIVNMLPWHNSEISIMLPWLSWAVYAWCQQGRRPALVGLTALVAFGILAGHPEVLFMVGAAVAVWTLFLLDYRNPRHLAGQIAGLAVALAVGLALSMIQLLPFLDVLNTSYAAATRPPQTNSIYTIGHLDLGMALDWILPRTWGQVADRVFSDQILFTESNGYVGLLAIIGIALVILDVGRLAGTRIPQYRSGDRRKSEVVVRTGQVRLRIAWAVLLLLAWLIVYDTTVGRLIRTLPILNQSVDIRWIGIIGFAGLVLGAFGWDWFARRTGEWVARQRLERWPPGRLGGAAISLLAVGLVIMLIHALGIPTYPVLRENGPWLMVDNGYRFYWAIWAAGVALALLGAMLLWAGAWRWRWLGAGILCTVLVLDLWRLLFTVNGTAPADHYYPTTSFLRQVEDLVPPTERILIEGDELPANTGLIYGIRDWRVQDITLSERAHNAAVMLDPSLPRSVWNDYNMMLHNVRLPIAPLLGMRYFIFPVGVNPNTPSRDDPTVPAFTRLAYKDGLGLWRAEGVPGFAYLSDNLHVAQDEAPAAAWMKQLDWQQTRAFPALVEAPPQVVAGIKHDPAGTSPGSTDVIEYTPGHIKISVKAARESLLVVSESWYPGWRGTLDGKPVDVLRANYLSQGVVVPAGTHTVELNYEPDDFKSGMLVGGVGLVALVCMGIWAWRTR